MNEFECIDCGFIEEKHFDYAFTMADGEVWTCKGCGDDIVVEFQDDKI